MRKGLVFDIERFSIVDGPGIRTVVFLKGCNMKCRWCHNPDGLSSVSQLMYDPSKCIFCGECLRVCPEGAHESVDARHVLNRGLCVSCFRCADACVTGSLSVAGKPYSAEALVKEALEDRSYFIRSGGGVTFTGGEPMLQPEFLLECLKRLRGEGVSCAMETNLSFPFASYEPVLPYLDLLMFDVKSPDCERHAEATGLGNERVLENLAILGGEEWAHLPLIARTPVIPRFNDDETTIRSIAALLQPHRNLMYYELLAYHPLGEEKRAKLGLEAVKPLPMLSAERMLSLGAAAKALLPNVRINGVTVKQTEAQ